MQEEVVVLCGVWIIVDEESRWKGKADYGRQREREKRRVH